MLEVQPRGLPQAVEEGVEEEGVACWIVYRSLADVVGESQTESSCHLLPGMSEMLSSSERVRLRWPAVCCYGFAEQRNKLGRRMYWIWKIDTERENPIQGGTSHQD